LVQASISFMREKGVETLGLYAYADVIHFYEKLGFKVDSDFSVMKGTVSPSSETTSSRKASPVDIPRIMEFDERCFGVSRRKLLEPIISDRDNLCYVRVERNQLVAYAVAKHYDSVAELGPVVCPRNREDVSSGLVRAVSRDLGNPQMFVVVPSEEEASLRTMSELGFKEDFRVKRMFFGPSKIDRCVCFAESLERG